MNCKAILTTAAAGAVLSVFSAVPAPEVSVSGMSQDSKGVATISYTLSAADAVVTLDIETNATGNVWASIGGAAVSSAQGDVWKKVEIGTHTIKWDGASCWADHKIPANGIRAVVTAWALDNTPDYMAVDISANAQKNTQRYYPAAEFVPGGVSSSLYKTTMLLMRKIMGKGVTWTMGSVAESGRDSDEQTQQVALENNYYIGIYEVTQTQWELFCEQVDESKNFAVDKAMRPMGYVPRDTRVRGATLPDAPTDTSFLGLLKNRTGLDFDLPSETQWEFAARAGNGEGRWGDGSAMAISSNRDASLDRLARYLNNPSSNSSSNPDTGSTAPSAGGTAIVGSYAPNAWGLYDMHGNVWELCVDNDSSGKAVVRGGSYKDSASNCRAAKRSGVNKTYGYTHIGFRVICTAGLQ